MAPSETDDTDDSQSVEAPSEAANTSTSYESSITDRVVEKVKVAAGKYLSSTFAGASA